MTTTEIQPAFVEKSTYHVTGTAKLDLEVPRPSDDVLDPSLQSHSQRALRLAQQILFLPRFSTSEHLFHGENMGSDSPSFGLPAGREAHIDGGNFSLFILIDLASKLLDDKEPLIRLYLHSQFGQRPAWQMTAHDGLIPKQAESWLTREVLSPTLSELMAINPPGASVMDQVGRLDLANSESD